MRQIKHILRFSQRIELEAIHDESGCADDDDIIAGVNEVEGQWCLIVCGVTDLCE